MFYSAIFAQAVVAMTEDKSFRLQTPQASRALKIVFLISENIPSDDNAALEGLSKYLVDSLNDCILDSTYSHKQSVNSHLLWSQYFMKHWVEFLHISVKEQLCTILAQYVTQTSMDSLIHQHFPLPAKNDTSQAESELSYTEENALMYASGYVVRSVFEDI